MDEQSIESVFLEAVTSGAVVPCTINDIQVSTICIEREEYLVPIFIIVNEEILTMLTPTPKTEKMN